MANNTLAITLASLNEEQRASLRSMIGDVEYAKLEFSSLSKEERDAIRKEAQRQDRESRTFSKYLAFAYGEGEERAVYRVTSVVIVKSSMYGWMVKMNNYSDVSDTVLRSASATDCSIVTKLFPHKKENKLRTKYCEDVRGTVNGHFIPAVEQTIKESLGENEKLNMDAVVNYILSRKGKDGATTYEVSDLDEMLESSDKKVLKKATQYKTWFIGDGVKNRN